MSSGAAARSRRAGAAPPSPPSRAAATLLVASGSRHSAPAPWRLLAHVVAPTALALPMIALFFSGVPALAAVVAPPGNREFGVLEHLQLAALGAMIAMSVRAARSAGPGWPRRAWATLAAGAAFVFLEEIDYGLHYYELAASLATGVPVVAAPGVRNVHNIGENTDVMKLVADALLVVLFVVVPLVPWSRALGGGADRRRGPLGRVRAVVAALLAPDSPLRPSRWYAATIGVMVLTAQIPHALLRAGYAPGSLGTNLSEFRELLVYYLFALYVYDVSRRTAAVRRFGVVRHTRGERVSRGAPGRLGASTASSELSS